MGETPDETPDATGERAERAEPDLATRATRIRRLVVGVLGVAVARRTHRQSVVASLRAST